MPATTAVAPSARPRLRPGLRVVRRGRDRLQVGLVEPAVVLPRTPLVEATLTALTGTTPLESDPATARLLAQLDELGLLTHPRPTATPADDAWAGPAELIDGFGAVPGVDVAGLLAAAGVAAGTGRRTTGGRGPALVLHRGELAREVVDDLVRAGRPHLLVRALDGGVVLGPYAVPGRTACLRCLDAHAGDTDPELYDVIARYADASARPRHDGSDAEIDPALLTVALGWAVRDLATARDGGRPATWSTTVWLPARLDGVESTAWLRHPACPCGWVAAPVPPRPAHWRSE